MQITETRKAIIEFTEPYMDKTLSEGCLVLKNNGIMKVKHNELYEGNNIICFTNGLLVTDIVLIDDKLSKILGHYDITSVIKYFKSKHGLADLFITTHSIIFLNEGKVCFDIPNKPLVLYSIDEDERLLDLLINYK